MFENKKNKNNEISSDRNLSLVFDNTNDHAICLINKNGIIQNWNRSAENLIGYSKEYIIGKNYTILFSREAIRRKFPEKAIKIAEKNGLFKSENICVKKEGNFFWAGLTLNPVNIKSTNKLLGFVLIIEDISQRKESERQKDEYIGIASHELRTPVSALSLYAELLAERLNLENDKKTLQLFEDIKAQISRMVNLVEDLLVVNEIERNKLSLYKKPFDIHKLLKKVTHEFQGSTTTHKIILKGKGIGKVIADPNRISQVLVNLIANGIKYSPLNNKILVSLTKQKDKAIISVQDFGGGITKEEQKEIFRKYFRSYNTGKGNISGLGLGLYISKKIIDKHNEKMWVKSKKGEGATFFFSLCLS
jgi:PAS domain S-box-containing protein